MKTTQEEAGRRLAARGFPWAEMWLWHAANTVVAALQRVAGRESLGIRRAWLATARRCFRAMQRCDPEHYALASVAFRSEYPALWAEIGLDEARTG